MTREEITEKLKSLKADIVSCGGCEGKNGYVQALTETIEALQTEPCEQIKWERDIAIGQLKALGYGLGEKIENCEDAIEEIWKDIPGFEGFYEASNKGSIRSVSRIVRSGRGHRINPSVVLKPSIGQWGYEQVSLRENGKKYNKRVNRLIAETFIPNPNNYPQVNHIDGNKTNNCVSNLEWCNSSQNMKHCFDNGLSRWKTKIRIVETGIVYDSISECARSIGGYISLIQKCLNGKRKTHKGYHFEIVGDRASDKFKGRRSDGRFD